MSETHINVNAPGEHLIKLVTLQPRDLERAPIKRTTLDLGAFLAYLKRWSKVETAAIFYTKTAVVCLLDDRRDLKPGADPDSVKFAFTRPSLAKKWLAIFGKPMKHDAFREFLEERYPEITGSANGKAGADLFTLIANLSISKSFTYDGAITDRNNYKIGFTTATGGDTVNIPKWVTVTLPLMEGLDRTYNLVAKLELEVPKTEGEKPTFTLKVPDLDDVFELVAKDAMAVVAEALPGYLITYGFPGDGNRPDEAAF